MMSLGQLILFLNRVTRPHKDVDFVILRKDQNVIQKYLSSRGWDCFIVQIG